MESFYSGAIPTGLQYTGGPYTLGQIFTSTTGGSVIGIQFYRTSAMSISHTGAIYDSFGNLMAQVSFMNIMTGWQQASFSTPVVLVPNAQYVVAMLFPDGTYLQQNGFTGLTNNDLVMGTNCGVWIGGNTLTYPTGGHQGCSFAIDVLFEPGNPPPPPIPFAVTATLQSKAFNTLDSGSIGAVSSVITRAIANGRFSAVAWYLWTEDEVQGISDALTTYGYEVTFTPWNDGTYELVIRWPHK